MPRKPKVSIKNKRSISARWNKTDTLDDRLSEPRPTCTLQDNEVILYNEEDQVDQQEPSVSKPTGLQI